MNAYKQILANEYGEDFANKIMKRMKRVVNLSNAPSITAAQNAELSRNQDMGYSKAEMLAATAILQNNIGTTTANEDMVLGRAFERKNWDELVQDGLVQWFRVAPPYQFVFLA